ncbi:hypothetical protein QBC36DRAFT_331186 [Triangularia setosa]|uniref:Uncharacterized protein n=1 Tax=Triangularia setosa TaxID=2587417 RepID=A0AAN6W5X7_9PEZI|nr:hypothetical protein QBC36DRAFT_331186 [Podospora setosa]
MHSDTLTHTLTDTLTDTLTHTLTHTFTHTLTHTLTNTLTNTLTYTLTYIPISALTTLITFPTKIIDTGFADIASLCLSSAPQYT